MQGTLEFGIEYAKGKSLILVDYCDSDWGGNEIDMRYTSGYAEERGGIGIQD